MAICAICGKRRMFGHNIRHKHSGLWEKRASKTQKIFKPNLHRGLVLIGGIAKKATVCASCLSKNKTTKKVKKVTAKS